jgi:hypothetical protein
LGHGTSGTRKVFLKIVKKSLKIEPKFLTFSYLRFSRGHEKHVKNVSESEPPTGARAAAFASGVAMSARGQFLNIRVSRSFALFVG